MLFDALYLFALPVAVPVVLYAIFVKGKYRSGWWQRLGHIARRSGHDPCIWIHAVSLGEVNATRSLVTELQRRLPGHAIVISATTQTGYDAARRLYPDLIVFRYPLDFSWVVRRVLRCIRPAAILLMELEVWPNLIRIATNRGIPVCIVNGRITEEKSMRRFRKPVLRGVARFMFSRMACVAAQNETYAARFRELGVREAALHVVGSMKFDTAQIADAVGGAEQVAAAMGIDAARPVLVAGSTGPGEEEILLDAWERVRGSHGGVQLVIVPRKPERFEEVARLIEGRGLSCVRRSRHADGSASGAGPDGRVVFLGDTMGELRKFYSLAMVVFVGRTLVPMGGSDVMEVAGLGKPMLLGPFTENFAEPSADLCTAGAARRVTDAATLAGELGRWIADPAAAKAAGRAGQQVVRQNAGATGRTVDQICAVLSGAGQPASRPLQPA